MVYKKGSKHIYIIDVKFLSNLQLNITVMQDVLINPFNSNFRNIFKVNVSD